MEYSENEIQHILKLYKQRREKDKERYDKIKDTEEFKIKNRQRASEHYHKNKQTKKDSYQKNKEFIKCRNSYNYYAKLNREEEFKKKFPDKYLTLVDHNYFKEKNPSSSTETSNSSSIPSS